MANPISGLQRTWWHTPRSVRTWSEVSWVLAAALAATGIALDRADWWTHHPFLLNLASSLTAFLAGAPIAIIAFGALSDRVARRRELHALLDDAHAGATKVADLLAAWMAGPRDTTAQGGRAKLPPDFLRALDVFLRETAPAFQQIPPPGVAWPEGDLAQDRISEVRQAYSALLADPSPKNEIRLAVLTFLAADAMRGATGTFTRALTFGPD